MANPVLEQIHKALTSLVTFRVTTLVGQVSATLDDATLKTSISSGANVQVMQSSINLINGDITTVIDPAYVSGELTALPPARAQYSGCSGVLGGVCTDDRGPL